MKKLPFAIYFAKYSFFFQKSKLFLLLIVIDCQFTGGEYLTSSVEFMLRYCVFQPSAWFDIFKNCSNFMDFFPWSWMKSWIIMHEFFYELLLNK